MSEIVISRSRALLVADIVVARGDLQAPARPRADPVLKEMGPDPKIVARYTRPEVDDPEVRARDLGELVAERFKWTQLAVVSGQFDGWDVALRVDCSYSSREEAVEQMEHFAHCAAEVGYLDGDDAQ